MTAEGEAGPWDVLRRVFAPAQRNLSPQDRSPISDPPSAPAGPLLCDDIALRRELAEERAAIIEHLGGKQRRQAEAQAYRAYGLELPC